VQNSFAALIALAKYSDGRAARDQLHNQVALLIADAKFRNAEYYAIFDHIDILQSGLVVSIGDTLEITERGWSLLHALGLGFNDPTRMSLASPLQSLNLIDELVGPEARQKIFDFGSKSGIGETGLGPLDEAERQLEAEQWITPAAAQDHFADQNTPAPASDETSLLSDPVHTVSDAPDFLIRKFGSGLGAPPRSGLFTFLDKKMRGSLRVWRRHLRKEAASSPGVHSNGNVERGLLAVMSVLAIAGCAGAVAALTEIKALKSELASTQRDLLPLKEQLANATRIERAREASDKLNDLKRTPPKDSRDATPPLLLSREEIQLVRDYIKPAPAASAAAAPVNVGDPVMGPTIPFPSPITEKVPKLLGATFAIRSGVIVIVRKDSQRADAVLGPN